MNTKQTPSRLTPQTHQRGADKLARVVVEPPSTSRLPKPPWIRAQLPTGEQVTRLKQQLRASNLVTVCEEAQCPNLGECFGHGTATFMILGDVCTRRCPFCDVAHGQPQAPDPAEPQQLAALVAAMQLQYVVLTSVNRDDLRDGGAQHYADCLRALRSQQPAIGIEVLVPDFRGREERALAAFVDAAVPDVFNHNLETVPRLYPQVRPGADYQGSLQLLRNFARQHPQTPTKSGLMVGLGETQDELVAVMEDLRDHGCTMLTIGQYLQPSRAHLPVVRYWSPAEFAKLKTFGTALGFAAIDAAPMVRSSYRAERLAGRA